MVHYENKHFVIDGKKTFLYGAECHYFRLDPREWRDRLQKIKHAGFNLVSSYVPWIWHEPEEGQIDLEGTTHPRRNLRAFLDMCLEYGLYSIVRPGPYVMSELKNEGIPHWLLDTYPEIIARTQSGQIHPTRVISYLHPLYLHFVEKWYAAVSKIVQPRLITNDGSIIMFQLDNEIGMLHWVTNMGDHHPDRIQRFAAFERTYNVSGSNTELAKHWAQVEFARYEIAEYVRVLGDIAYQNGINVPFIVNVHGFKDFSVYSRGVDYPIGLSQLREAATTNDVVLAGDFYPGKIGYDNFHDLVLASAFTDALGQSEQPLFSAEFQSGRLSDRPSISPSDVDLITRLCVACGMNALNYYMYCGGDNVEGIGLFGRRHEWQAPIASNGDLRPSYAVTEHLGHLFQTFGDALCDSPKRVDTHIGFYTPYYATETVNREDAEVNRVIGQIQAERESLHFDGLWRLLSAANISYGAVDVQRAEVDVLEQPTLWMATTKYMDPVTQEKLVRYVQQGGNLVIGPQIPAFDLNGDPCEILRTAFGVVEVGVKSGFQRINICGMDSVFCRHYAIFDKPSEAELVAFSEQGESEALAYRLKLGQGQVLVLGVGMTHEYQYQLEVIRCLAHLVNVEAGLAVTDETIVVTERTGKFGSLISVLNVDDVPRTTHVLQDNVDLFGGAKVSLQPKSGKLLPRQFQIAEGIIIDYSTVELVHVEKKDAIIHASTGSSSREIELEVEFYVPGSDTGVVSWTLDEGLSLETPATGTAQFDGESALIGASIEMVIDGTHQVVRMSARVESTRFTFRIVREAETVGLGSGR